MQRIGIIGGDADYAELMAAMERQRTWDALHEKQLDFILNATTPEVLAGEGLVLVCESEAQAQAFRPLLDARGMGHVTIRVAAPVPTYKPEQWTPAMAQAKEVAWRAQQPRHASVFTKSQPSPKARKAARKRAKAGRKASR